VPEGDVVWRSAHRLNAALGGRVLTLSDLRWPSLATVDLTGRMVLETVARGKHLLTRLAPTPTAGALTLHSHLRMEGGWRVDRSGEPADRRGRSADVRAVLGNDTWTATGSRLGMLDLVATRDEDTLVGHLGPDVLGPDWDLEQVLINLAHRGAEPVGSALLDQRVVAGVGTFYLAETMFLSGRSPWTPVADIPTADLARIVQRAYDLLHLNRDRIPQVTTGDGRPGREAYVHGRSGRPCRRCGTAVRVAPIGTAPADRVAFYCPHCQPGPTPTDDGRAQRPLGTRSAPRTPRAPRSGRSP
jgi:endonuclease VIII